MRYKSLIFKMKIIGVLLERIYSIAVIFNRLLALSTLPKIFNLILEPLRARLKIRDEADNLIH